MSEVLIKAENVSKKFCRSLKASLWYGVQDILSDLNPFGPSGNGKPFDLPRVANLGKVPEGCSKESGEPESRFSKAPSSFPLRLEQGKVQDDVSKDDVQRATIHQQLRTDEFWAVNNVSFELRRGECLGL